MKRQKLDKPFIPISNRKKTLWFPWFIQKYSSALKIKWYDIYIAHDTVSEGCKDCIKMLCLNPCPAMPGYIRG